VYIISSVLSDSKYALHEKNEWLDKYLPEIPSEHRIFPPCGTDKKDYIPGGVGPDDFLLDDYSANLKAWEPPAKGIKIMNGINGTKVSWHSDRISAGKSGSEIAYNIVNIMQGLQHYNDIGPNFEEEKWDLKDVYLTNDGYARFDINVFDSALGKPGEFEVSGLIRLADQEKNIQMQIVKIDTYGIEHPILEREHKEIEAVVEQRVQAILAEDKISTIERRGVRGRM